MSTVNVQCKHCGEWLSVRDDKPPSYVIREGADGAALTFLTVETGDVGARVLHLCVDSEA